MNESELRVAFEEHKDAAYRFTWRMTNSPAAAEPTREGLLKTLDSMQNFNVGGYLVDFSPSITTAPSSWS